MDEDIIKSDQKSKHNCEKCQYRPTEEVCEILDSLNDLLPQLQIQTKETLVYIAGYVSRNDENADDSFSYYKLYGSYLSSLNRGGLKIPGDDMCEWLFLSYILFVNIDVSKACQISLSSMLMDISESNHFETIEKKHSQIVSNIFFKNYCCLQTPSSDKEPKVKLLKLS